MLHHSQLESWQISMFLENVVSLALLKNKNDFGCTFLPFFFFSIFFGFILYNSGGRNFL